MYSILPNPSNYNTKVTRAKASVKFIVVHYTANDGDTARGNLNYFRNNNAGASAHFFADDNEVCSSVPVDRIAWHCGASKYRHSQCRNENSIGVEMCSRKNQMGQYYITTATQYKAAELIASLMREYQIPMENVLRHWDVTGKNCPAPLVMDSAWEFFKDIIRLYLHNGKPSEPKEVESMKYYETLDQIPAGELRETVRNLVTRGIIKGTGSGLHLSEDMVRMFVFLTRAGVLK